MDWFCCEAPRPRPGGTIATLGDTPVIRKKEREEQTPEELLKSFSGGEQDPNVNKEGGVSNQRGQCMPECDSARLRNGERFDVDWKGAEVSWIESSGHYYDHK